MKILRTDPDRFGIRARLLTLLLPAILGLLALDSWNDYRALRNQVQDAYDQAMLESVHVLRGSLSVGPDGLLHLNAPLAVQAVVDAAGPLQKHLHIGLTPQGAASASEVTLLGATDLPAPPARPASAPFPVLPRGLVRQRLPGPYGPRGGASKQSG
jgi:two-component system sensor histidine kinase TctE